MQVNSIQPRIINQHNVITKRNSSNPTPQTIQPNFKGANGALLGLGGGLIGGLIVICGTAISGGAALPALLGAAGVLGSGAGGAYIGDKAEDKLKDMLG